MQKPGGAGGQGPRGRRSFGRAPHQRTEGGGGLGAFPGDERGGTEKRVDEGVHEPVNARANTRVNERVNARPDEDTPGPFLLFPCRTCRHGWIAVFERREAARGRRVPCPVCRGTGRTGL
jgi:hypothetical protein